MITYDRSPFGLNLLFRVNGSAIYRGAVPGCLSVMVLIVLRHFREENSDTAEEVHHPYAIGILLASITFLLVFRVQQAYARYWEAASSVHHMMSKWMDAVVHTAAYHMQCDHYDTIKPPSFYEYPELNHCFLTRDRDSLEDLKAAAVQQQQQSQRHLSEEEEEEEEEEEQGIGNTNNEGSENHNKSSSRHGSGGEWSVMSESERIVQRATKYSIERIDAKKVKKRGAKLPPKLPSAYLFSTTTSRKVSSLNLSHEPSPLEGEARLDGNWGALFAQDNNTTSCQPTTANGSDTNGPRSTYIHPHHPDRKDPAGFASHQGGRTVPLFLQELVHLASLVTGVALSTLRNDIEGAQSPLDIYEPGEPWPEVDPGSKFTAVNWSSWTKSFWYFLGTGRNPAERTKYNASRPLPVIGGVSEAEIQMLQRARGPYAKTQLCWMWLSEFIIREHLAGTLGKVGPPIISRIIQFLGDGMIYYNHARKIMFIPWPFPHAQLSAIYVLVTIPAVAGLMDQYIDRLWLACLLVFFTVTCLHGIHEVARELENPFRNVPNELPLVTMQAQYNEALYVCYAGYHPDLFWRDAAKTYMPPKETRDDSTKGTVEAAKQSQKQSQVSPSSPSKTENTESDLARKVQELTRIVEQQAKEMEKLRSEGETRKSR